MQDEWRQRCPTLYGILAGYLHQDFCVEYGSAEEALADAVASVERDRLDQASVELAAFRPSADDEVGAQAFANAMCYYHPPGDGLTYSTWRDHLQAVLRARYGA